MKQRVTDQQLKDKFFTRVRKSDGCWIWTGALDDGYGMTSFHGANIRTHRLSWIFAHGAIPAGKWVLHKCDVRSCVNPEHLYLGDIYRNNADTKARDRYAKGKRNSQARLNDEQAKQIFARAWAGEYFASLSKEFGISKCTVSLIKRGLMWQHATKS